MIKATGLTKIYDGKKIIDGFSREFQNGKCYAITGPSGCGKTTLLNMLLRLVKPDEGGVTYDAEPHFGVLFQEDRLIESLSSVRNVSIVAENPDEEKLRREISRLLPEDSLSKPVKELSGGMKRRAALVRAFSHGDIIILDEPFSELDEENIRIVSGYIKEKSTGKTVIIAEHEFEYLDFCENIVL